MIGIFDTGAGGVAALRELRRLCPSEDILFLADRQNAPYGTKSEDEILRLAEFNISRLARAGAERVLIACCTASTVYERMSAENREISVPIITPTALLAATLTKNSRVAVIATEHTARSRAFGRALSAADDRIRVTEIAAQELVSIAERSSLSTAVTDTDRERIKDVLIPVIESGADTLVLGCTHFSQLKYEIEDTVKNIKIADAAKTGAQIIAKCAGYGLGATVFL